jgi:hypothetical protein
MIERGSKEFPAGAQRARRKHHPSHLKTRRRSETVLSSTLSKLFVIFPPEQPGAAFCTYRSDRENKFAADKTPPAGVL